MLSDMFVRTMNVVCDFGNGECGQEITGIGPEATTAWVTTEARSEGWSISSAGHFCPKHRQRKARA